MNSPKTQYHRNRDKITRVTRWVPLVEQELLTLPEHLRSTLVFSYIRVARSLVLCVMFCRCCLSFFFWPLCYLSFIDLRILVTPLVSSSKTQSTPRRNRGKIDTPKTHTCTHDRPPSLIGTDSSIKGRGVILIWSKKRN